MASAATMMIGMLVGLPRYCSASGIFAEARTDDFYAIMRKRAASLLCRVRASSNTILRTVAERLFLILNTASGQHLGTKPFYDPAGICLSIHSNSLPSMQRKLKDCVVVVGNIRLVIMENTVTSDFVNVSFPNLREVTGFLVLYRVIGLESIGQLFPNLTRIRGEQLINNFALVVHDMPELREIGLYSLLKIDRGGVTIWGGTHTCFVETIDWNSIAPNTSHSLTYPKLSAHCNMPRKSCKCGPKKSNHCWNNKRCQHFLLEQEKSCHPECLGCKGRPHICSVCRHFTYHGQCVSECPLYTILLPSSQYCITIEECASLNGWLFKGACVFDCPIGFEKIDYNIATMPPTCEPCVNCKKTCPSMDIHSLSGIQQAENCYTIDGSLTIRVGSVPGATNELKKYLRYVELVADYVYIHSSAAITSLDFLPNLKTISGRQLANITYSFILHDMTNLEELFVPEVTKNIHINRGRFKVINNPKLCMSKINELKVKFPVESNETDIILNGYSGGCGDTVGLHISIINETAAAVTFSPRNDSNFHYTVLYAKVPWESYIDFAPEACSESEWFSIHSNENTVFLTSLHPASTYAVCVETLVNSKNPIQSYFARTTIVNFTMPFVKPEPPFIYEIVAISPNAVGVRWVDHKDYRRHITSYQIDVILVEIPSKDVTLRDHCNLQNTYDCDAEVDDSRHAVVLQPPEEYKSCEANCPKLISLIEKMTLVEDNFDICSYYESDCNQNDEAPPKNSSFKNYVKTLAINITRSSKLFHVHKLAPFRDYRFRLRACVENICSRSNRKIIRTLRSEKADIPSITHLSVEPSNRIIIKWEPPDELNGPIFVYRVQVLPGGVSTNETLPNVWCVYPEVRSLIVRSQAAKELQVRVCSSTLGSFSACSEWKRILIPEDSLQPGEDYSGNSAKSFVFLIGIACSLGLLAVSVVIGYLYKKRRNNVDIVPLVDATSMNRSETDPPIFTLSDFMPLYSVPLTDALLD